MLWASRRGQGDEFMDPTGTGSKVIPFWRSGFARSDDSKGTREALNLITHSLDASMVGFGFTPITPCSSPAMLHPDLAYEDHPFIGMQCFFA